MKADAIEMSAWWGENSWLISAGTAGKFWGLALAFGFMRFRLFGIQVQFLPIYAKKAKANATLFEVLDIVESAQGRVDAIYKATGHRPVNTPPLSTDNQKWC